MLLARQILRILSAGQNQNSCFVTRLSGSCQTSPNPQTQCLGVRCNLLLWPQHPAPGVHLQCSHLPPTGHWGVVRGQQKGTTVLSKRNGAVSFAIKLFFVVLGFFFIWLFFKKRFILLVFEWQGYRK